MQTYAIVRLLLLYIHVMAFAIAFGCVLREDAKLLSSQPIDPGSLGSAARLVRFALAILWASGAALIVLDTGGNVLQIADNPKLLAKLSIVGVLTVNGIALHCLAFPVLCGEVRAGLHGAWLAAALGSISAASWLAATALGIARAQTKGFTYADLMVAYAGVTAIAITFALLFVRPRIARKLERGARRRDAHALHAGADLARLHQHRAD